MIFDILDMSFLNDSRQYSKIWKSVVIFGFHEIWNGYNRNHTNSSLYLTSWVDGVDLSVIRIGGWLRLCLLCGRVFELIGGGTGGVDIALAHPWRGFVGPNSQWNKKSHLFGIHRHKARCLLI